MVTRAQIDEFLSHKALAFVGASRKGRGFGCLASQELTKRGYTIHFVHPEVATIAGQPCGRTLKDVADKVAGVVIVTPPASTERLVREAVEAGIRRVWLQQGAESDSAIRLCEENGVVVIHDQCILMFAEPAGFPHGVHRWLRKVFGHLPP